MSKRDYLKDYKLVNAIDSNGKEKATVLYTGVYSHFESEKDQVDKKARLFIILSIISVLLLVISLSIVTASMKLVYVMLPYVFTLIPLYNIITISITASKQSQGLIENKRAKQFNTSFPASAFFMMLLPMVALVGEIVAWLFKLASMMTTDIVFAICLIGIAVCGFLIYKNRNYFKTIQNDDITQQ